MSYMEVVKPGPGDWDLIVTSLQAKGHKVTRGSLAYVAVALTVF